MSRAARDWAWALRVTPPQKLVILALAERADDSGTCWPSLTHLTEMTGLVRSTVALALVGLEETQLIARDRGRAGRSTRYRLLTEGAGDAPGSASGSPADGPPASPGDGPVRESVVRQTDQGSPADGPAPSPGDGLVRESVVRQTDQR